MFLELSFDSRAGDKEISASDARNFQYDRDETQEMSLDELISDFHQSATTNHRSRLAGRVSSSSASPLRTTSPPKRSKLKESDKKKWNFADRARQTKLEQVKKKKSAIRPFAKKVQHDDSSDDEEVVMPTPRLDHILRNKPTLIPTRRAPVAIATKTPTRSKPTPIQRRKPAPRSPALSSPSLTPPSLSPLTSSPSPVSVEEDIYTPVSSNEDSIDALIGKDIRNLNNLILSGNRRGRQSGAKMTNSARSPTTDEMSTVLRQSTCFRKTTPKDSRPPLRLQVPKRKSRPPMPDSPPPPPPPLDGSEEVDEEDSFAEEIRKLRESRRLSSVSIKVPEKEPPKEEDEGEIESSDICASAALKVRNASNTINDLLLEALKPFEGRQREVEEKEKAEALEQENAEVDSAITKAAVSDLQSATQTIVSQLDLTFADMTESRKADLKAEADAAAAAKETEEKGKKAADEKKKVEEKEAKERETAILRLIPMQGKLLTSSIDIENMLTQLESEDTSAPKESTDGAFAMEAEIKALRRLTQLKIQEIEARMSSALQQNNQSHQSDGISWQAYDWVRGNVGVNLPQERIDNEQLELTQNDDPKHASAENEEPFQEVLQRRVVENLELTMLKLKHVLDFDTKEAGEAKEQQQQEAEELEKKQAQQQQEDERKQRDLEDAEIARHRVMGLTSVNEVEGWVEEGWQLREEFGHDRSLSRLMTSLENRMNVENADKHSPSNQDEALRQFDRLKRAMDPQQPREDLVGYHYDEAILKHSSHRQDTNNGARPECRPKVLQRMRTPQKPQWIEVASSPSKSESDVISGSDSDALSCSDKWYGRHRDHHDGGFLYNRKPQDARNSSELQQRRRKRGSHGLRQDIARTIQALQADRRQKASWIRVR